MLLCSWELRVQCHWLLLVNGRWHRGSVAVSFSDSPRVQTMTLMVANLYHNCQKAVQWMTLSTKMTHWEYWLAFIPPWLIHMSSADLWQKTQSTLTSCIRQLYSANHGMALSWPISVNELCHSARLSVDCNGVAQRHWYWRYGFFLQLSFLANPFALVNLLCVFCLYKIFNRSHSNTISPCDRQSTKFSVSSVSNW